LDCDVLKNNVDVAVLHALQGSALSGSNLLVHFKTCFHQQLSSGTVYACLNRLELSGLVKRQPISATRRLYVLTAQGKSVLRQRVLALVYFAKYLGSAKKESLEALNFG